MIFFQKCLLHYSLNYIACLYAIKHQSISIIVKRRITGRFPVGRTTEYFLFFFFETICMYF